MIGGTDFIIPVANPVAALDLAVRLTARLWPGAVFEDGETGEAFSGYGQVDFSGRREILAYRDLNASDAWRELGADPSLDGTMIHFLCSDDHLTIVVDTNPGAEMQQLVQALERALKQDVFLVAANERPAA